MKTNLSVIAAAMILVVGTSTAMAQSAEELLYDGRNTENVTTYGMGYDLKRYSPLKQINTTNVKRLVPVWNATLSNLLGEQAQPLVYNGVMYVTNAAWTFAIDVATGRQIWRTEVGYDPDTPRVVCCGVSNKGPAIYNGKLFRTTLDAHVVALDAMQGDGGGEVVMMPDGTGYLMGHQLPALGTDGTYQLWARVGDGDAARMVSLGVLGREPGISPFRLATTPSMFEVTAEPASGSDSPGANVVLRGEVA